MSTSVYKEQTFEAAIEADLLDAGWLKGASSDYSADLGLDTGQLDIFIGATQNKAFEKLITAYGDIATAQREFHKRVAAEIDKRGTLDVLRNGIKDRSVTIQLAYELLGLDTKYDDALALLDAGIAVKRARGLPSAALKGYEWTRWLDVHGPGTW